MAVVAIAAVLMMLVNRHKEFEAEADYQDRHVQQIFSGNGEAFRRMLIRNDYHGRLARKYRIASWLPFLPVLPDPPGPFDFSPAESRWRERQDSLDYAAAFEAARRRDEARGPAPVPK